MSPDGTRIAYDRNGEVRVVNLDGTGDRSVLSGGRGNLYPSWVDDRRLVALRRVGLSAFLVEVDLETGRMTERVALPEVRVVPPDRARRRHVRRDGRRAGEYARPRVAEGRHVRAVAGAGRYSFPVWSPDGRQLAVEMKQGRTC